MSQPQPQTRPFADFVVPETNDADEDAVPEERKIKAEQVEQTLRTEHPDADDEFVSAIRQLVELNASDLHLVINDPPMLRVDGKLRPAKGLSVWTKDHTYEAVKVMTNELEMERFKDDLELDISFAIGDLLRFRVNVYRDRMGVCAALRTIPTEIKPRRNWELTRVSPTLRCCRVVWCLYAARPVPVSRPHWPQSWTRRMRNVPTISSPSKTRSNSCISISVA